MKTRITIIAAALGMAAGWASAQSRSVFEGTAQAFDSTRNGQLLLNVVSQNFFRNDEYFGDYIEGYTLPGYTLEPSLVYYPTADFSLRAGISLVQYAGTEKYSRIVPVVAADWRFAPDADLIVGCLRANSAHRLPEQLLDEELQLTSPVEMGVQCVWTRPHLDADIWLNWQQFIELGDTIPERFMAGVRMTFSAGRPDARLRFEFPTAITVQHIGGQISDYDEPMQSMANGTAGVVLTSGGSGLVSRWHVGLHAMFYHELTDKKQRPFADGYAICPEAGLTVGCFEAAVGFWHAHDFYACNGNPLFMSVSSYRPELYRPDRNMLTAQADLVRTIARDLRFSLGAKLYYDTDRNQTEYYYGLALVFTPTFRLATVAR